MLFRSAGSARSSGRPHGRRDAYNRKKSLLISSLLFRFQVFPVALHVVDVDMLTGLDVAGGNTDVLAVLHHGLTLGDVPGGHPLVLKENTLVDLKTEKDMVKVYSNIKKQIMYTVEAGNMELSMEKGNLFLMIQK